MAEEKSLPCTIFDHVLWLVQAADGTCRRAQIRLGDCLLLFTSLDALQSFINDCDDRESAQLRPVVFSRCRKEFGQKARAVAQAGLIRALFDTDPGPGGA